MMGKELTGRNDGKGAAWEGMMGRKANVKKGNWERG